MRRAEDTRPIWPVVDLDEQERARRALYQPTAPTRDLLLRLLDGLRRL